MLLAGTPGVSTIAVGVGNQLQGSLFGGTADTLGTNQVEVTLALTAELQVTLIQYVVDSNAAQVSKTCTCTNLVNITSGLGCAATCLQQQLGCIQQGLGIAVDALVVIVVQVL